MEQVNISKSWDKLKVEVKTKWPKFDVKDIDLFKKDLSELSDKVQKTYSVTKDIADKQITEFKHTFKDLIN